MFAVFGIPGHYRVVVAARKEDAAVSAEGDGSDLLLLRDFFAQNGVRSGRRVPNRELAQGDPVMTDRRQFLAIRAEGYTTHDLRPALQSGKLLPGLHLP